jgi:phosphoglucosamine mutase
MAKSGIAIHDAAVGDRYVLEAMRKHGYSLGGEQSGHIVFAEHATTGDGLLTALVLLERMAATGAPLGALAGIMTRLPQVLINVRADRAHANAAPVLAEVDLVTAELGESGRVLLRPSGTEPVVRVMVEARSLEQAEASAQRIAAAVAAQ